MSMRTGQRSTKWMLGLLIGCLCYACGGGNTGNNTPAVTNGTISGRVVDTAGAGLTGVAVSTLTAGSRAATTSGPTGAFTLTGVPSGNTVVTFDGNGKVQRRAAALVLADQTTELQVTLRDTGFAADIDATVAQTVTETRTDGLNASVQLQANSILNANNERVPTARVQITTSMPSDPMFADVFPGLFVGVGPGTTTGPIESFGYVDVDLTSAGGEALKLDPSLPATLTIPVEGTHDPGDATLPIWSLDPTTGTWQYEGDAVRDATGTPVVYRADVTHFTPYNLDKYFAGGDFTISVIDAKGAAVPGALITVNSFATSGGVWQGRATSGANGLATLMVPAGFVFVDARKGALTGAGEGHGIGTMPVTIQ